MSPIIIKQHGVKEKPHHYRRPEQPKPVVKNKDFIESLRIQKIVDAVEQKKNYKRDPNLIFRHIVEEIGELSRALYIYDSAKDRGGPDATNVIKECVDIISLCNYLSTVLNVDINKIFPIRLREVMAQYNVKLNGGM